MEKWRMDYCKKILKKWGKLTLQKLNITSIDNALVPSLSCIYLTGITYEGSNRACILYSVLLLNTRLYDR